VDKRIKESVLTTPQGDDESDEEVMEHKFKHFNIDQAFIWFTELKNFDGQIKNAYYLTFREFADIHFHTSIKPVESPKGTPIEKLILKEVDLE
jgi:hypothetical protein